MSLLHPVLLAVVLCSEGRELRAKNCLRASGMQSCLERAARALQRGHASFGRSRPSRFHGRSLCARFRVFSPLGLCPPTTWEGVSPVPADQFASGQTADNLRARKRKRCDEGKQASELCKSQADKSERMRNRARASTGSGSVERRR